MASARIVIDRTKNLASALSDLVAQGEIFRQRVEGMNALLQGGAGYAGDNAAVAADLGASVTAAQATTIMNLLGQMTGELTRTATVQVSAGATTGTRQLIDAISFGR